LLSSVGLIAWAAWRLRPVSRRFEDSRRRLRFLAPSRPRPACGDHPMLWKERYFAGGFSGSLVRRMGLSVLVLFCLSLHQSLMEAYSLALDEFFNEGYKVRVGDEWPGQAYGTSRHTFHWALNDCAIILYLAAFVAVAVESATGISGEREKG